MALLEDEHLRYECPLLALSGHLIAVGITSALRRKADLVKTL